MKAIRSQAPGLIVLGLIADMFAGSRCLTEKVVKILTKKDFPFNLKNALLSKNRSNN